MPAESSIAYKTNRWARNQAPKQDVENHERRATRDSTRQSSDTKPTGHQEEPGILSSDFVAAIYARNRLTQPSCKRSGSKPTGGRREETEQSRGHQNECPKPHVPTH
jgi:hypothetical protein